MKVLTEAEEDRVLACEDMIHIWHVKIKDLQKEIDKKTAEINKIKGPVYFK